MKHRLKPATVLALAVAALSMACGSEWVKPSPSGAEAQSRPRDCSVEFLRSAPERGYVELGEMYGYFPRVVEPQDVLRERACELGADAVIVTRDFLISTGKGPDRKLVAGTAIKYRDLVGVSATHG